MRVQPTQFQPSLNFSSALIFGLPPPILNFFSDGFLIGGPQLMSFVHFGLRLRPRVRPLVYYRG